MSINKLNHFLPLLRPLPTDLKKYLSQKNIDMSYTQLLRMARTEAEFSFNPGLERVEMEAIAIDVAFHWNNKNGVLTKSSLRREIGIASIKYLEKNETKSFEHNVETKSHHRGEKTQEIVGNIQSRTNEALESTRFLDPLSFDPEEIEKKYEEPWNNR